MPSAAPVIPEYAERKKLPTTVEVVACPRCGTRTPQRVNRDGEYDCWACGELWPAQSELDRIADNEAAFKEIRNLPREPRKLGRPTLAEVAQRDSNFLS